MSHIFLTGHSLIQYGASLLNHQQFQIWAKSEIQTFLLQAVQVRIICFQDSSSHCLAVLDISLFTYKIGLKSFQVGFLKLTMYFVRICRPSVELSKISLSQPVNNYID